MSDGEAAAIGNLIQEYHRVFSAGDIERVLELWDAEGTVFEPGSATARGPAQLRGAYERGYATADYNFECTIEDVVIEGNLAVILSSARGRVTVKADGTVVPARARQVFTARRQGGRWRLLHYMFQESPATA